jgi:hypothetical protein
VARSHIQPSEHTILRWDADNKSVGPASNEGMKLRQVEIAEPSCACLRYLRSPRSLPGRRTIWTARLDDNIGSGAGNDSFDLCLLGLGHLELIKCLLEIVEKCFPFCCRDHQVLVRVLHRAARVLLRPAGGPADHFRDKVFEACRGNAMMSFIYPWIRVQARIDHDPVDEVVYNSGDTVDPAKPFIKAGHISGSHQFLPEKQH